MNRIATLLLFGLLPASAHAQFGVRGPLILPIVTDSICPGEGCSYGVWHVCQPLILRSTDQSNAPIVARLPRGSVIHALTGRLRIAEAGVVIADSASEYRDEQDSTLRVSFAAGDTIFALGYYGEGERAWYHRGYHYTTQQFWNDAHGEGFAARYRLAREAKEEWWVQLRAGDGRVGWIRIEGGEVWGQSPHYEQAPACSQ